MNYKQPVHNINTHEEKIVNNVKMTAVNIITYICISAEGGVKDVR